MQRFLRLLQRNLFARRDLIELFRAYIHKYIVFFHRVTCEKTDETALVGNLLDGAGWHKASSLEGFKNMRLIPLPPYSPELNPVEHLWDELREKFFGNFVFHSLDALEDHLEKALLTMELDAEKVKSIIVNRPWIISSPLI